MFRRFFLKRTLSRVAALLVAKYGKQEFFSMPQVELVVLELQVSEELEYCLQLFVNPDLGSSQEAVAETRRRRESLYRYFNRDSLGADIEANRYWKILNLIGQKVPGGYTQIATNEYITGSKSLR